MNTTEIYALANKLTEQEINNILGSWEQKNETKSIESFNSLVRLGDSNELAMATVIAEKYNSKENYTEYYNAYCM
jgi:hypothetical protein